ncbi:MAG: hypothetical protein IJJ56_14220 [Prevotella sp.]|nr:hypothetical protein [Prevotella sp.]
MSYVGLDVAVEVGLLGDGVPSGRVKLTVTYGALSNTSSANSVSGPM